MSTWDGSTQRSKYPAALLTFPTYGGTLAAVRQLGRSGVPVVVTGDEILAAARWSRYALQFRSCPSTKDGDCFVEWLLAYGRRHPGHVLLPTSDETSFLFASHLKSLEANFRLYQPPLESILQVLDKKLLWEACRRAGVATIPSWFPSKEDELRSLGSDLLYPVLIKPRSQIRRIRRNQGAVARNSNDLLSSFRSVTAQTRNFPGYEKLSNADAPMIQQFAEEGDGAVYSVSGFMDRSGEFIVARGAMKIMQRRQPVGIGVCFEACGLEDELLRGVKRLCREIGYFGVFEIEFVRWNGTWAAIDFNPRFYNQMALDIARGLPLPMLIYLGACGEEALLKTEMRLTQNRPDESELICYDKFTFRVIVAAMRISGRMSRSRATDWHEWRNQHRAKSVDIALDYRDPVPGFVHVISELKQGIQAIPRFLSAPRVASPLQERGAKS